MTIISIALAALSAVALYRRHRSATNTHGRESTPAIDDIRRSTSVVLAIADAIWTVLDALMFLTKPRSGGGFTTAPLRPAASQFGTRIAADLVD